MIKGSHHTEETKKKMRASLKGRKPNSGSFKNGDVPWSKGLTKKTDKRIAKICFQEGNKFGELNKGRKFTEKHRKNLSEAMKGRISWNKGKKLSRKTRQKMSKAKMGHTPWNKDKTGLRIGWNKGKYLSKETKRKLSIASKGKHRSPKTEVKKGSTGAKSLAWQGGKSFEPYSSEFNNTLKRKIRKRDKYTCQECGFTEEQLGYILGIHHIDYNKKNNNSNNLISLCKSCHSKTNWGRKKWTQYYQNKILPDFNGF